MPVMKHIIITVLICLLLVSCSSLPDTSADTTDTVDASSGVEYPPRMQITEIMGTFDDPTSNVDKFALTIPFIKLDTYAYDSFSSPVETEYSISDEGFWENVIEQKLPHDFILH